MTPDPIVSDAPNTTWTQRPPEDAGADELAAAFRRMILHPDYPCLGARSVMNRHRASVLVLPRLGAPDTGHQLLAALTDFAATTDMDDGFASFVAIFRHPERTDEEGFERLLWRQLQCIAHADSAPWSGLVSDDPDDPHFSFSAGGTPYFVVGLHPDASRVARRAPFPTLVFNAPWPTAAGSPGWPPKPPARVPTRHSTPRSGSPTANRAICWTSCAGSADVGRVRSSPALPSQGCWPVASPGV